MCRECRRNPNRISVIEVRSIGVMMIRIVAVVVQRSVSVFGVMMIGGEGKLKTF